jgi:hypothetical protein
MAALALDGKRQRPHHFAVTVKFDELKFSPPDDDVIS